MDKLTFEQLPQAVSEILKKLENIEGLLAKKSEPQEQLDNWMDLDEYCAYHPEKPARATVYPKLKAGEIPAHKRGKKWYFLRSEVDQYLKSSRVKTSKEIIEEVEAFIKSKTN